MEIHHYTCPLSADPHLNGRVKTGSASSHGTALAHSVTNSPPSPPHDLMVHWLMTSSNAQTVKGTITGQGLMSFWVLRDVRGHRQFTGVLLVAHLSKALF